jgi:predicted nucleotidyltransferase
MLAHLLLNPDRAYTVAELARASGAPYATVHREARRLIDVGLVSTESVGRAVRMRANSRDPAYGPAAELLRLSYGPTAVLPRVLSEVEGIDQAYIYGSWAARRLGSPGDAPGDIDVLVIGNPRRADIYEAADVAERRLGREVNIRTVDADEWHSGDNLFLRTVRSGPLVRLDLHRADR